MYTIEAFREPRIFADGAIAWGGSLLDGFLLALFP
jgi:hypothetical protein